MIGALAYDIRLFRYSFDSSRASRVVTSSSSCDLNSSSTAESSSFFWRSIISIFICSVISCPCAMVAMIVSPSLPRIFAEFQTTVLTSPDWCWIGISTTSHISPVMALLIRSIDSFFFSSGKSIESSLPIALSGDIPVSFPNALLYLVILYC